MKKKFSETMIYKCQKDILKQYNIYYANIPKMYKDAYGVDTIKTICNTILISYKLYKEKNIEKKLELSNECLDLLNSISIMIDLQENVDVLSKKQKICLSKMIGELRINLDKYIEKKVNQAASDNS